MAVFGNGLVFLNGVFSAIIANRIYQKTWLFNIITYSGSFPFAMKPLWSFISDISPLYGYRFKSYIVGSSVIQVICCVIMFFIGKPSLITFLILNSFINLTGAINSALVQGIITIVTKIDAKIRFPELRENSAVFESKSHRFIGGYQGFLFTSEFLFYFLNRYLISNEWVSVKWVYMINAVFSVVSVLVIMLYFKERKVND